MTIAELLSVFPSRRILVVGDVMLDHYILGDVHRISPEAPVPVVQATGETRVAGGAANVAHNLAAVGLRAEVFGVLGADAGGRSLQEILRASAVEASRCVVKVGVPTIVKTRVVARHQQLCRIDHEGPRALYNPLGEMADEDALAAAIGEADAVIVSDYAKGVVSQALLNRVIALAGPRGILVAIDPKPARRLDLRGVGLLTPNRSEALQLAELPEPAIGEDFPLAEICARIHEIFAPTVLVVTLGAEGMAVARGGVVEHLLPTEAREVFDVSGAGDTVIAILTAALVSGASPVDAARMANLAAGVVVSKMGTATVSPGELLAAARRGLS
jgi:D-beta-D-heptose 7-phosphate kinase/D-beta-D-heptose 1-phosphate adenosyltransferase